MQCGEGYLSGLSAGCLERNWELHCFDYFAGLLARFQQSVKGGLKIKTWLALS